MIDMDDVERINDAWLSNLTKEDMFKFLNDLRDLVSANLTDLQKEILFRLMDFHHLDDDMDLKLFYFLIQERIDEQLLNTGKEPTKDKEFADACIKLVHQGKIEKLTTLDFKTKKLKYGFRINADFKKEINEIARNMFKEQFLDK